MKVLKVLKRIHNLRITFKLFTKPSQAKPKKNKKTPNQTNPNKKQTNPNQTKLKPHQQMNGHSKIWPLKQSLSKIFKKAIQNHQFNGSLPKPGWQAWSKTCFFHWVKTRHLQTTACLCGLTWKAYECVWTKSMLTWTNNTLVIHIISAVEPNRSGCVWSSAGSEFREWMAQTGTS